MGFLERFNAAILDLDTNKVKPLFIESHRLAPFNPRATDVNVIAVGAEAKNRGGRAV